MALFTGLALLGGLVDLSVRTWRGTTAAGVLATVAGGLLIAFSLFGLIVGLLGIGTVGLLLILAGRPMKLVFPPDWHPDPMGRYQYRFWDGRQWSPYAATDGVGHVDPIG